jgi:hypothetical protein
LDDIEDQGGIFLLSGDMLIISGRANYTALQQWGDISGVDPDVLYLNPTCGCGHISVGIPGSSSITIATNTTAATSSGLFSEVLIFTAVGTGHVSLSVDLVWGGIVVRSLTLDIYVN